MAFVGISMAKTHKSPWFKRQRRRGATVGNCAVGIGERGGVDVREVGVGRWGEKKVWVVNERGKVVCWNEVDSSQARVLQASTTLRDN